MNLNNSAFLRYAALSALIVLTTGSIFLYAYDTVKNIQPPTLILTFLGAMIGFVINSVGVTHGVNITNSTVERVASAQLPTIQRIADTTTATAATAAAAAAAQVVATNTVMSTNIAATNANTAAMQNTAAGSVRATPSQTGESTTATAAITENTQATIENTAAMQGQQTQPPTALAQETLQDIPPKGG
jgi:hypothetical protein